MATLGSPASGAVNMTQLLNYAMFDTPPKTLTLEELDGGMRALFPVEPKWSVFLGAAFYFTSGAAYSAAAAMSWYISSDPFQSVMRRYAFMYALWAVALWLLGVYRVWCHRRFGWIPSTLIVNRDGITHTWMRWGRSRSRNWRGVEIKAIRYIPIRANLNWRRTEGDLFIEPINGRSKRFRLSSPNPKLASEIAMRFAQALGLPLTEGEAW